MAANQVIANRALEFMGFPKGNYEQCNPHNHVNCSQSNDAYPAAWHVAMFLLNAKLVAQLRELKASFRRKAEQFHSVIKIGRTQLQEALPMRLGQEFRAFAETWTKRSRLSLNPLLGLRDRYQAGRRSLEERQGIVQLVGEKKLSEGQINTVLDPKVMIGQADTKAAPS